MPDQKDYEGEAEFLLELLSGHLRHCRRRRRAMRRQGATQAQCARLRDHMKDVRREIALLKRNGDDYARTLFTQLEPAPSEVPLVLSEEGGRRTPDELRELYGAAADEHRRWLADYAPFHTTQWERQLSDDAMVEGALWEALARRKLAEHVDRVEPAEELGTGGPDFRCHVRRSHFYTEASCLRIDTVSQATGLEDKDMQGGSFRPLTQRLCELVEGKVRQARARADAPTIVFAGTLHQTASMHCLRPRMLRMLLTGTEQIAVTVAFRDAAQVGSSGPYGHTELHGSAFLSLNGPPKAPVQPRNRHVAGLLVGTGSVFEAEGPLRGPTAVGLLQPRPQLRFSPCRMLPGVPFYRLRQGWQQGRIGTRPVRCGCLARLATRWGYDS